MEDVEVLSVEKRYLLGYVWIDRKIASMTSELQTEKDQPQIITEAETERVSESDTLLCPHCKRTATNGIKCQGICVADSDY
ncbi:hypothetical protein [Leptolyngbya sp. FACHB-17]|uniref:hypothetical protein n=1 Tax=unclassified Leptolyngbya TaxID=2650499 RepID=UPI0016819FF4|nr:hypothetical protein [Leptolyngbya sp. FACHB-17]MBD2081844.1 hypothetical protein [Leptolyngbya sp. FACHB-17]